jgi:hypothetical protein
LPLGLAGAAAAPFAAAAQTNSLLNQPIPRSGELLPAIGLGTAVNFAIGEDAAKRAVLAGVLRALPDGGGAPVDSTSYYGNAESIDRRDGPEARGPGVAGTTVEALGARVYGIGCHEHTDLHQLCFERPCRRTDDLRGARKSRLELLDFQPRHRPG